ncbi:MAG: HesB/YadR/YfhF [Dehalococcoidia bacterium]|nr:HesB/YadR/YfhF [Dehalococcoidia bacterium]
MITVSALAAEKLRDIIVEQGEEGSALRVICLPGPNGGAQYMLALEKEARGDDLVVQADGVSILIDAETVPLMEGAEIDYLDGLMRSGFVISNPNIQAGECACGGSCSCGGH